MSKVRITISLLNDVKNSHKAYQQYIEKQKEKEASERGKKELRKANEL